MNTRRQIRSDVGTLVATIPSPETVRKITGDELHPSCFEPLASYNWMAGHVIIPTIMVPGAPGKWTPQSFPLSVPQDSGLQYIDQNGDRNPKYPLEPLFRSVLVEKPEFNLSSLDLVTDRNNFRKILMMLTGERNEMFRIDIQLVGKTLLFTRWEENTSEFITEFRGYGHSFEKRCTTYTSELKGSTGHHRVVKYNLDGLEVVARFEVDAYLSDGANTGMSGRSSTSHTTSSDLDTLTSSFKSIRLSPAPKSQVPPAEKVSESTLRVIQGGYKVPHSSLVELKTRAHHRPLRPTDVIYQLWFGQVRHLIAGYHSRGKFIRTEQKDFAGSGKFSEFEQNKASELRRLVKVVRGIRTTMVTRKLKKAVLLFDGRELRLYERTGVWDALPSDLLSKWE